MENVFILVTTIMLSFLVVIAILAFAICAVLSMKKVADMTIELSQRDERIRELESELNRYKATE